VGLSKVFLYLEKHSFCCSECDFPEANELELDSKEKQVMCSQLPKLEHQPGLAIKSVLVSSPKCLELSQTIPLGFSDLQSARWVISKSCYLDAHRLPV